MREKKTNKKTWKNYRLTIVRTYVAGEIYVRARSEEEALASFDDFDFIETGSDRFNDMFAQQRKEVFADEDDEEEEEE